MGVRDWFRRGGDPAPVRAWRDRWVRAIEAPDQASADTLRAALAATPPLADDLEVEQEMMDALDQLLALARNLDAACPPVVETSHRVVGADVCHFSAPASTPDDASQASGRVLLTSTRAIFVGGPALTALPWHAVRKVVRSERDVLLVRSAEDGLRLRFNTFGDAVMATAIARYLGKR